jgi:5-methylcytosine-specific restriction enzyme subunit McrC
LSKSKEHITVFEHEALRFDKGEKRISKEQFQALQSYYGEGVPYYNLCYNGIRFNEHVGVIQIGSTIIEVLPKADNSDEDETKWRNILIGMLKAVGSFDIKSTSDSKLKIRPNTILDLYFEMFIKEIEFLLHRGLVKKYRKKEGNVTALKGALQFTRHIQQNLTHQERFYVRYTAYNTEHLLHFIIYKTLWLLKRINTNAALQSRIETLILNFPEMPEIKVTQSTFDKIVYNRKTKSYKKSIEIARLLLLRYHPDLNKGKNNVLALMFDMNKLWEQFVYVSIKKDRERFPLISQQTPKYFWKPVSGRRTKMKPDIVINQGLNNCAVLDTKWKNLNGHNPSPEDLRQMYVYHEYYRAQKVALVYPGVESGRTSGNYLNPETSTETNKECSIIFLPVESEIKQWQKNICAEFEAWLKLPLFSQ